MQTTKRIKVSDLLVSTENPRFDTMAGQKEAIEKMIEELGDKLHVLGRHIIDNGLNPADIIQVSVSSHDKTKYNVLEGNRRVVALKMLSHPDLVDAPGHAGLKKKFKKLHDDHKTAIPKDANCLVWDDPGEANKWIKLKHTGENDGAGTVNWSNQQQQRFDEKMEGKSPLSLQVVKLLGASADVPTDIKMTNLSRMLADPEVRDVMGLQVSKGLLYSEVDKGEVLKGLTKLVEDILRPGFNVNTIYTKEDRRAYLTKFGKGHKPNLKKTADKPWDFNDGRSTTGGKAVKPKKNPNHRNALIPKACVLKISNPKLNELYYELQRLNVHKHKHSCSVAFRVFVELSLDCYVEEKKLAVPKTLFHKVTDVANHLESNNLADKSICKGIRSAINNPHDLMGTHTWNAYVHNSKFSPTPQNLITSWNNMQPFMEKVWENIK
jgi:hypothetical protein